MTTFASVGWGSVTKGLAQTVPKAPRKDVAIMLLNVSMSLNKDKQPTNDLEYSFLAKMEARA